ncbi:hypothetical protein [Sporosarcina koreensis]|uniref:Ribbon-helix-helix protein, copG family n=1 Tax=Sporosarcina koreensis TaxID=334735 RepID=A0ABW0TVJ2_9BACL
MAKIDLNKLDEVDKREKEKIKQGSGRRNVTDRFKDDKKKTVTTISVPTPLLRAINEYCKKAGISKAAFFSQLAHERLKNEDLET